MGPGSEEWFHLLDVEFAQMRFTQVAGPPGVGKTQPGSRGSVRVACSFLQPRFQAQTLLSTGFLWI